MARWRTLNKRAKRIRARDAQTQRNIETLLAPALEAIVKDAIHAAFAEMARAMERVAAAWVKAVEESPQAWGPLDPKYARVRRRRIAFDDWPDVVLEDILDAEYLGEEE